MKKEVQEYISEMLRRLILAFPHKTNNHYLTIGDDGNLWLWIYIGDKKHSIIFDEDYEDLTPKEVVEEIVKLLRPH